jgi:formyltetrahydrofolate synthetase
MNVEVLSIEPAKDKGIFNVVVSVENERHQFTMKGETEIIANKELHAISGDKDFCELFKFNQHLAQKMYKLIAKVYNNEAVELPVLIGELYPAKVTLASLKKRM